MLPINHPLGTISVESGKRIGVSSTQWRNWMLQMTAFLTHQVHIIHICGVMSVCLSANLFGIIRDLGIAFLVPGIVQEQD